MAVSIFPLLFVLEGLGVFAIDQAHVLGVTPHGKLTGAERKGIMRRDASAAAELEVDAKHRKQRLYGFSNQTIVMEKMKAGAVYAAGREGAVGDPWEITAGAHQNTGGGGGLTGWNNAPAWAPHEDMPAMPSCTMDVTQDMGLSDYGSVAHSCSACQRNCTEENKQLGLELDWLFEPSLETCNAFDVQLYANWSDIDQLGCSDCSGKGLRHKFHVEFATNAGEGVTGYEDKTLGFKAWMGPEVTGGPRGSGSAFAGLHVFEVEDTEQPSHSEECNAANPAGRWLAIPGELRGGESFNCVRICSGGHPCNCGRNTGMRCTAAIAMKSSQLFAYRIRSIASSATGSLDTNSYVGTEWEVTAKDLSDDSAVMIVGRVVLAGNAAVYGIKNLRQAHEHLGCSECDLFYESTIISGPFIQDPVGVHVIRSADGQPPPLTSESCELFRISSMGGLTVKFETGPGLWPPFQVNDTIFTCSHQGTATCPA